MTTIEVVESKMSGLGPVARSVAPALTSITVAATTQIPFAVPIVVSAQPVAVSIVMVDPTTSGVVGNAWRHTRVKPSKHRLAVLSSLASVGVAARE
jgi:hypothetical protein